MFGTLLRPVRREPHPSCEVVLWMPRVVRRAFIALRREQELISSKSIAGETVLLFGMILSLTTWKALILDKDNIATKSDFSQCAPGFSY
jgi:hypothetical protein